MNSCPFKTMAMRMGLGVVVIISGELSAFSNQPSKSSYWGHKGAQ
jgi:hypothetical protein